ncbi:hypothetical protein OGAPHI_000841 [Ogataea philodendri]|uniref:Uncharacterized protein n=1 Tax=Ogataea philodendri TaxID=1378263 RepID=A0A9P8PGE7_9ASCO|nr:uncharacterized protein OGAPHI_000841 [Ogataea philodendri]KAH3671130.1 hypothetical protein OGAPHI_000841 [Ogataea philodendri]
MLVRNVGQQNVLVSSQSELTNSVLDHVVSDLVQTGLVRSLDSVLDSTILDETGVVVQSQLVFTPAKVVDVGVDLEWLWSIELLAPQLLNLALVNINSHVVNGVL